jgi:type IV pilus biogenesis protein CpaD/CtpE
VAAFFISLLLFLAGCAAPAEEVATKAPVTIIHESAPDVVLGDISRRCFPTDQLVQGLWESYRETQVGIGKIKVPDGADAAVVSLFRSPRGSWTLAVINDQGMACLIVWGERWMTKVPPKGSV